MREFQGPNPGLKVTLFNSTAVPWMQWDTQCLPDDWAFTVRMDVPWQPGALEDSGWSAELSAASYPAGVAVLYPPCARLELLQLHTSWRKGQAQGSPDAQLHGDSLSRHEEGDDLTSSLAPAIPWAPCRTAQ